MSSSQSAAQLKYLFGEPAKLQLKIFDIDDSVVLADLSRFLVKVVQAHIAHAAPKST